MVRPLRLSTTRQRSFVSSLFTAAFLGSIITVAASNLLPCPAQKSRVQYADDGTSGSGRNGEYRNRDVVVVKRPRRWIEEKPASR